MIDCNICKNLNGEACSSCIHGEMFERNVISEPRKIILSHDREYCGHCGYISHYAKGYKRFYCIRCGGLNLRVWNN